MPPGNLTYTCVIAALCLRCCQDNIVGILVQRFVNPCQVKPLLVDDKVVANRVISQTAWDAG